MEINWCEAVQLPWPETLYKIARTTEKVKIMGIPVAFGVLVAIAGRLPGSLAQTPGTISEVELQNSVLLGTAQTLRRVFRLPGLC